MKALKFGLKLAYTGTIKEEILDKEEVAFFLTKYLISNHLQLLCNRYKLEIENIKTIIKDEEDKNQRILKVIEMISKVRGAYAQGGKIDMKKTSNIILTDFREGKIGRITIERVDEWKN